MKELKKLILAFGFIAAAQAQTSFEQDAYFSNLNNFTFFNPELSSILQFPNNWNDVDAINGSGNDTLVQLTIQNPDSEGDSPNFSSFVLLEIVLEFKFKTYLLMLSFD